MTIDKALQEAQQLTHRRDTAKNELQMAEERQAIRAKQNAEVAGYTDKRDLVNQLLGRIQLAQGLSKLTTAISVVDLACIKEKRLYRYWNKLVSPAGIRAGKLVTVTNFEAGHPAQDIDSEGTRKIKTDNRHQFPDGISEIEPVKFGTWGAFCEALGMSREKADEDIRNLSVFGNDALTAMNRCGLGYRDLRKLRQLPEGERSTVVGEIEADLGDREAIVSLIDEISAKHAREKDALQKQTTDLTAELTAARKLNAEKNAKIDELDAQLHGREQIQPDERAVELSRRLYFEVIEAIGALLGPEVVIKEILEWENAPQHLKNSCYHGVARIRSALFELQKKYSLPDVSDDLQSDAWMEDARRSFAAERREAGASEVP